jgi:hypothetical protein
MLNALQCVDCKHFEGDAPGGAFRCKAFPNAIPDAILFSEHDHHQPYPGDHGILFEPSKPDDTSVKPKS